MPAEASMRLLAFCFGKMLRCRTAFKAKELRAIIRGRDEEPRRTAVRVAADQEHGCQKTVNPKGERAEELAFPVWMAPNDEARRSEAESLSAEAHN